MISLNSQGQDKCYQPKEEKSGFPGAIAKKIDLKVSIIGVKASTRSEIDCISSGYFSLFRNREGKLNRFMYCLDI